MAPDELGPAPKTRERAITSVHRVLAWKCDLGDRREGAIVVGRAGAAFVVTSLAIHLLGATLQSHFYARALAQICVLAPSSSHSFRP
jgi:hypothetical protein